LSKSPLKAVSYPLDRANSYEHDKAGFTTEDAKEVVKGHERRLRKEKIIAREVKKLNPIRVYGKGRNLIISHGSTKGAILDALPGLKNFRFLQISYLKPFPKEEVAREIKRSKKVILVENSATGALSGVIAEETGLIIKDKVLKYDARPFTPDILINQLKKYD
jgi:2-oxoglutarate ferredoxin oxidoreductase subunit alpha